MLTDVLSDAPVTREPAVVEPPVEPATCGIPEAVPTADFVSTEATRTAPIVLVGCDELAR